MVEPSGTMYVLSLRTLVPCPAKYYLNLTPQ